MVGRVNRPKPLTFAFRRRWQRGPVSAAQRDQGHETLEMATEDSGGVESDAIVSFVLIHKWVALI